MVDYIRDLYIYFLVGGKQGREAFERFYDKPNSREFVRKFALRSGTFWSEYMTKYSQEIRDQLGRPFQGVITPRGVFR